MELGPSQKRLLEEAAIGARDRAYAPYSAFRVGAALWLSDEGRIVTGGNVENASYGLTLCAERAALVAAIAQGATPGTFLAMVVAADAPSIAAPCGACRQVLFELCCEQMPITCVNVRDGARLETSVGALLPHAFGPRALGARAP